MPLTTDDTQPAHTTVLLLAKPSGSTCNIDCTNCFVLLEEAVYPNEKHRTSDATLDELVLDILLTCEGCNRHAGKFSFLASFPLIA